MGDPIAIEVARGRLVEARPRGAGAAAMLAKAGA
jgi:hypothetical protein